MLNVLTGLGLLGLLVVHPPQAEARAIARHLPAGAPVAQPALSTTRLAVAPEVANKPLLAPAPPNLRGAVPVGKGMWIWLPQYSEGGNAAAIVAKAQHYGINYLYVRTGSSVTGFQGADFLNALLPLAHQAGIKVYGWDFPYLDNIEADVGRASQAAHYTTPSGDRIDGFAADIEFRSMGVNLAGDTTSWYGHLLRDRLGFGYPLIAVVPRPTAVSTRIYPYATVVPMFDAIAPMVYWLNNDPAQAVQQAFAYLNQFGKPIIPVGQAYDGAPEGGPAGVPNRGSILRFIGASADAGATSVSFWSWQAATDEVWQAVSDAAMFQVPVGDHATYRPDQIRSFQMLLTSLGFGVTPTGLWGADMDAAVKAFQTAARVQPTGQIDVATRELLMRPVAPPLK